MHQPIARPSGANLLSDRPKGTALRVGRNRAISRPPATCMGHQPMQRIDLDFIQNVPTWHQMLRTSSKVCCGTACTRCWWARAFGGQGFSRWRRLKAIMRCSSPTRLPCMPACAETICHHPRRSAGGGAGAFCSDGVSAHDRRGGGAGTARIIDRLRGLAEERARRESRFVRTGQCRELLTLPPPRPVSAVLQRHGC